MCEQYWGNLTIRKNYDLVFYAFSPNQPQQGTRAIYFLKIPSLGAPEPYPLLDCWFLSWVCPSSRELPSPPPLLPLPSPLLPSPLLPSPSRLALSLLSSYHCFFLYFFCLSCSSLLSTAPNSEIFLVGSILSWDLFYVHYPYVKKQVSGMFGHGACRRTLAKLN